MKKPRPQTLEEIERLDKTMLVPDDVAGYLGCDPYSINIAVRTEPELLGFPVIKLGTRVRIPKEGFLRYCRGLPQEDRA